MFTEPDGSVVVRTSDQVRPALLQVEQAVETGLHAVGYLSYEAAQGLDTRLEVY